MCDMVEIKHYYGIIAIGQPTGKPELFRTLSTLVNKFSNLEITIRAHQCFNNGWDGLWVLQVPTMKDVSWETLKLFEQPEGWPEYVLVPMECLDRLRTELGLLHFYPGVVAQGYTPINERPAVATDDGLFNWNMTAKDITKE